MNSHQVTVCVSVLMLCFMVSTAILAVLYGKENRRPQPKLAYLPRTAIIYVYYEKDESYKSNFKYFLTHGVFQHPSLAFYVVIQGGCTLDLSPYENVVTVWSRDNSGYDFGGYGHAIQKLASMPDYKSIKRFIFVNTSTMGPFMPTYTGHTWVQAFLDMIQGDVKLAGSTINCELFQTINPHVQSYAFVLDDEGLEYLRKQGIFSTEYTAYWDVVKNQEVKMSQLILKAGWNINCLVEGYRGREYRGMSKTFNSFGVDIVNPGNKCFGREIHPYDVIFLKTSRKVASDAIRSLSVKH
jgi:hypothetical protein